MGNLEEERPDFDDSEQKENKEEDPRERFRRLTTEPPRPVDEPTDDTLGYYIAGPAKPDEHAGGSVSDSPDQTAGWHGIGHGEPKPSEVPPYEKVDFGEQGDETIPPAFPDETSIMAATGGFSHLPAMEEDDGPTIVPPAEEPIREEIPEAPDEIYIPEDELPFENDDPSFKETDLYPKLSDTSPSRAMRSQQVTPPPPLGQAGYTPAPSLDQDGMPLPRRVTEDDMDATQVTPAALTTPPPAMPNRRPYQATTPPPSVREPVTKPQRRGRKLRNDDNPPRRRSNGCLVRGLIGLAFVGLVLVVAVFSFMLIQYYSIAATLPDVEDMQGRTSQFETTRILDRNGNLLYEIIDPTAGRRTYVSLDEISPFVVAATISAEDENFYTHPGFNAFAIVRAFIQNVSSGEVVSGASSITQQVARMLFLDPEEANQRTYLRKVKEAILAIELTNNYSKDEILELFLNENFYGNLAYGVEAASETYFGTTADKLTLEQAAFLAGLPQAPSVYDVYTNREVALNRQKYVLRLMYETSEAQNCIYVSNSVQKICVDLDTASEAAYALENYEFHQPDVIMNYPHWVNYIRTILESEYDPQTIYRSGFTVETTLDPQLQDIAINAIQSNVALLTANKVQSGALVAMDPHSGEILAMVGSVDFYNDAIDGQINMAISPRQPGSSIKPITYVAAFEKGWTPATLIWDVETEFPPSGDPNDTRDPYVPVNYDGKYHGPVTVRTALSNSYNIPAVKALNFVGIYDDPNTPVEDGMIAMAHRLGITTLNEDYYGLSLTLGGGEVTLLDMTTVYSVFANAGKKVSPVAITRITNAQGEVVYEHQTEESEQLISPQHAYLISSILSDNTARTPAFGPNSVLNLPFPAAAKTGTTNDYRDNWTMGYTPDLAVGVWVGNPDYTEMVNTSGLTGAAPIWAEFMKSAIQTLYGGSSSDFRRPDGIVEKVICSVSGTEPSENCPTQTTEIFAANQLPLPKTDDLWKKVELDTWTRLLPSEACGDFREETLVLNVTEFWAGEWILDTDQGNAWAKQMGFNLPITFVPTKTCSTDDNPAILSFEGITEGQQINLTELPIILKVWGGDRFKEFVLSYRTLPGNNWVAVETFTQQSKDPKDYTILDLAEIPDGEIELKVRMNGNRKNVYAEKTIKLVIQKPTPTPTMTPTMTLTPTETLIPTETLAPTNTNTPVPTNTTTQTPTPTFTPSP